jgi:hypothetical protein
MAASTVVRTKRDGTIVVTDGTNIYTVVQEAGNFQFTVPLYAVLLFLDRGSFGSTPDIRKGDDQPMTLGWDQYLTDLGDSASPQTYQTIVDLVFELVGGYTSDAWNSTMSTHSDVKTWTVKWTENGSAFGESDKTYSFPYCVLRGNVAEGDGNTVTISGTSYALQPTLT